MGENPTWLIASQRICESPVLRDALAGALCAGHPLWLRATEHAGHAVELSAEASRLCVARVVAIGGDGTLNEVAHGLLTEQRGRAPVLGLVPAGTANDFAGHLGPTDDPTRWLDAALTAAPRPVDAGEAIIDDTTRHFMNVATLGAPAEISGSTDRTLKNLLGPAAYAANGVARLSRVQPVHASVQADDFTWEGELLAAFTGNARQVGGGFVVCPQAELDDGLLDLTLVPADLDVASLASAIGNAVLGGDDVPGLIRTRATRIVFESPAPFALSLDGELVQTSRVVLRARRHCVRMSLVQPVVERQPSAATPMHPSRSQR